MPAPTPQQLAELERAAAVLRARDAKRSSVGYMPHKPHRRQREFLDLTCLEALYGGAAGGGKSDALLMAALQYVHVPGYTALILRRTYSDLSQPGAIMSRAREWLANTDAKWNEQRKQFTFPSGAVLQFGYMETANDRYRYQGTEYQCVCWDEVTQFVAQSYEYMFSRLRKLAGSEIPLRVRSATNPGGIGHEWVRRRFIDPGAPERPFVPALLDDNPSLDAAAYRASLSNLDAHTRAQLEQGVWTRDDDGLVYHYDKTRNSVRVAPKVHHKGLALDFGVVDPTSFNLLGWRDDDPTLYVLRSFKVAKLAPSDAAQRINDLEHEHNLEWVVGDLGGMGKAFAEEFSRRFHRHIEPAVKTEKLANIALMNGDLEKGRIKVVESECESLTTEWLELPWHESRQREHGGFDNHCADGVLYGWRKSTAFISKPDAAPLTHVQQFAQLEARMLEQDEREVMEAERENSEWGSW